MENNLQIMEGENIGSNFLSGLMELDRNNKYVIEKLTLIAENYVMLS